MILHILVFSCSIFWLLYLFLEPGSTLFRFVRQPDIRRAVTSRVPDFMSQYWATGLISKIADKVLV